MQIALQGGDIELLERVSRAWGAGIVRTHSKSSSGQPVAMLAVNSVATAQRLQELGIRGRKSLNERFPTWMPESVHSHFVRGVFDGDGCLYFRFVRRRRAPRGLQVAWNIVGGRELVHCIAEVVRVHVGVNLSIRHECDKRLGRKQGLWRCSASAIEDVVKICEWMYAGASTERGVSSMSSHKQSRGWSRKRLRSAVDMTRRVATRFTILAGCAMSITNSDSGMRSDRERRRVRLMLTAA